jgi:hypothetical protein
VFINTKALRGNDYKSILNGTTVINQKKVIILKKLKQEDRMNDKSNDVKKEMRVGT